MEKVNKMQVKVEIVLLHVIFYCYIVYSPFINKFIVIKCCKKMVLEVRENSGNTGWDQTEITVT